MNGRKYEVRLRICQDETVRKSWVSTEQKGTVRTGEDRVRTGGVGEHGIIWFVPETWSKEICLSS